MTNRDQLNRLKETFRTQAFENAKKSYKGRYILFLNEESKTFELTLKSAFLWTTESSEGFDYWANICENPQNYLQDENTNEA